MRKKHLFVILSLFIIALCSFIASANSPQNDNGVILYNIESMSASEGNTDICYGIGSLDCVYSSDKVKWIL